MLDDTTVGFRGGFASNEDDVRDDPRPTRGTDGTGRRDPAGSSGQPGRTTSIPCSAAASASRSSNVTIPSSSSPTLSAAARRTASRLLRIVGSSSAARSKTAEVTNTSVSTSRRRLGVRLERVAACSSQRRRPEQVGREEVGGASLAPRPCRSRPWLLHDELQECRGVDAAVSVPWRAPLREGHRAKGSRGVRPAAAAGRSRAGGRGAPARRRRARPGARVPTA